MENVPSLNDVGLHVNNKTLKKMHHNVVQSFQLQEMDTIKAEQGSEEPEGSKEAKVSQLCQ